MQKVEYEDRVEWVNEEGELHRLDGPAVEWADGSKEWLVNDERHRLDGPACEYADGQREWRVHDKLHRLDGPAVEYADGSKEWFVNGERHRLDGPACEYAACEYAEGRKEWWVRGMEICSGELKAEAIKEAIDFLAPLEVVALLEAIECQG